MGGEINADAFISAVLNPLPMEFGESLPVDGPSFVSWSDPGIYLIPVIIFYLFSYFNCYLYLTYSYWFACSLSMFLSSMMTRVTT